ncbi:hypothetical protein ACEUD4_20035 [Aeromonas media]|uniref:hypothetical protein n=1 Tax=Aeromonas media TaxID=651 RepID=UPI000FB7DC66
MFVMVEPKKEIKRTRRNIRDWLAIPLYKINFSMAVLKVVQNYTERTFIGLALSSIISSRLGVKHLGNPMTDKEKPWYKKTWAVICLIFSLTYAAVINGPQFFENIQKLPAIIESTYNKFSVWYFDDENWSGFWSSDTEFIVDWQDLNLSDTDLVIDMESVHGTISGVIFTKNVCNTIPLLGMLMLDAKVSLLGQTADGILFEYINGSRRNLSTIKFRMDGSILHISPINDHFKFIPTAVKIIKQAGKENKNLLPMGEKGFIDVCRVQREKLFKKSQE